MSESEASMLPYSSGVPTHRVGALALWCIGWITLLFLFWLVPPVIRDEAFAILALGLIVSAPMLGLIVLCGTLAALWLVRRRRPTLFLELLVALVGWAVGLAGWWLIMESTTFDSIRWLFAVGASLVGTIGSAVTLRISRTPS